MRKIFLLSIICIVILNIPLFADEKAPATDVSSSITIEELKDQLFFLASDELKGRKTGTEDYRIAALYVVSQFKKAGLKPFFDPAGEGAGYFQHYTLLKKTYSAMNPVTVNTPAGEVILQVNTDIKPINIGRNDNAPIPTEVVYIGYGLCEPDYGWDDLKDLDIKGKTVIVHSGLPKKEGKSVLPEEVAEQYKGMPGLSKKIEVIRRLQPASVIMIPEDMLLMVYPQIPVQMILEQPTFEMKEDDLLATSFSSPGIYFINPAAMDRLFAGQEWSPTDIKNNGLSGYRIFTLKDTTLTTSFEYEAQDVNCMNVVGWLPGNDETLKDEYVVLAAHLDHVGEMYGQVMNGADDNASGVIGVMEIAEALALDPPRRPVIFIAFDSEEVGLVGSRYFLMHPPIGLEKIMVDINLDMISRSEPKYEKTGEHYALGGAIVDPRLRDIVQEVNEKTLNWPLLFEHPQVSGNSNTDAYPFQMNGIPSISFDSGFTSVLHSPVDDPGTVDYDKFLNISRLVCHVVLEVANMDEPLHRAK